ncbi:hypothetical protein SH591_06975 [Sphingomonas sp. LY54]|uniref:DUF6894 family protein n=1 Tax=Sphingomonadales TaxID=204457 RepID=UPI002ADEBF9A|nr:MULTISPECIES: hypothetical protein [Sphingomonadales]MEA1015189.1 hypothetical protein [Sphingosinicella sp. LY1275]WRP29913.1 hypothetical protein SH591_06975 [Sphingomonas sp. LY54]
MPRFYFHIHNHIVAEDDEGTELADAAAARDFAVNGARDLVCESVHEGRLNLDHYIRVTDADGQDVLTVTFREAFIIEGMR